jgi:hypothetical protein
MKTRTAIAFVATVIWMIFVTCVLYADWSRFQELELNAKGDFLAGFISPAVFLWLIIGYFQQGEELQQNTEALRIQGDELRNAVSEYKALVEATKRQVELMEHEQKERREREIRLAQMVPRYVGGSSNTQGSFRTHNLKIINMGHSVTEVTISCSVLGTSLAPGYLPHFDSGKEHVFTFQFPTGEKNSGFISFQYKDGLGRPSEAIIFFDVQNDQIRISYQPQEMSNG